MTDTALDRAHAFYQSVNSVPGCPCGGGGSRGLDFHQGLEAPGRAARHRLRRRGLDARRETARRPARDLSPRSFSSATPRSSPPSASRARWSSRTCPRAGCSPSERIHRQDFDNPILDLAHALSDPDLEFEGFERNGRGGGGERRQGGARHPCRGRQDGPLPGARLAQTPRASGSSRRSGAPTTPPRTRSCPASRLICDGIELPLKHRRKRIDLEARGLIKGAQVIYLGPGKSAGFSRLHVVGAEQPQVSAASIVKIEMPGEEEPFIPFAATWGPRFFMARR